MNAIALQPIRVRSTGQEYLPGDTVNAEPAKLMQWSEKGLVRLLEQVTPGIMATWQSPVFGRLEAPLMELRETTFILSHPLTGEVVELSKEWLVSLDERSAILEFDAGLSREEADSQARQEFFGLFRKGGSHEKRI